MEIVGACRLSIYLGNADLHKHTALSREILHRAHQHGLRGATTLQGIEGFGHSGTIHRKSAWQLTDRTPVTIHVIDRPERIASFLPKLDDIAGQCMIVRDAVDLVLMDQGVVR